MIVILIVITTYILPFFPFLLQVGSPKHETQALFFWFSSLKWYKGVDTTNSYNFTGLGTIFPLEVVERSSKQKPWLFAVY